MVACNDDGPSTSTSTSTGQLTSDVWKHFTEYDGQLKAMCSLCGKGIAYRGRTTNLRNHLLYKHPLIYSPKDKTAKGLGKKQSNLDTVVKACVCSEAKAKEITNCILNLICMDIRPDRMVECEGFK